MPALHDDVYDNGLNVLVNNTENLYILNGDPGLIYANIASMSLGNKASPSVTSPADRTAGGREVTIAGVTDGLVTGTGVAAYWAATDDSASKILASGPLDSSQNVTSGNPFTTDAITIGIPDPIV